MNVVVTPSRVELGSRCHRRHFLQDQLHKAKWYSPSLEFGSVVHAGASAYWLKKDVPTVLWQEWDKRFAKNPLVSTKDVSLELAVAMMTTYVDKARLAGPFGGSYKIIMVEDRLEIPLGTGLTLSLQMDRLVYDASENHLVIVDTKTSGRMDKRWSRQWELSLQMKLYKAAMYQVYGIEKIDVVIEGVEKEPSGRLEYVVCPEWSRATLDEALEQARAIAKLDQAVILGGRVVEDGLTKTMFNTGDCFSYGVECPFRTLCLAEPELRESILMSEYFNVEGEY